MDISSEIMNDVSVLWYWTSIITFGTRVLVSIAHIRPLHFHWKRSMEKSTAGVCVCIIKMEIKNGCINDYKYFWIFYRLDIFE